MIIKIIAAGIISAALSLTLRQYKSEYTGLVAVGCGAVMLAMLSDDLAAAVGAVRAAADGLGLEPSYITTLIKITGIAYLTQFGASVCEDAGERAIAVKIEFAGRITILLMSAPLVFAILNLITGILP
ncbi:MAG: hypothetical protein LBH54_04755 [Clostridiales bacterium]|jgi:stage III sporulation protein AD|nr:hypothetical protein [Clostridiales bacterium]